MKLTLVEKNNQIHVTGEMRPRKRNESPRACTTNDVLNWIKKNYSYENLTTVSVPQTNLLHNTHGEKYLKGEWVFSIENTSLSLKTLENKKEIKDTTINIVNKAKTKTPTSKRKKRSKSK